MILSSTPCSAGLPIGDITWAFSLVPQDGSAFLGDLQLALELPHAVGDSTRREGANMCQVAGGRRFPVAFQDHSSLRLLQVTWYKLSCHHPMSSALTVGVPGYGSMTTQPIRTKALSIWDQGCMRWTQVAVSFTGGKAAKRRKMYEAHFVVPDRGRECVRSPRTFRNFLWFPGNTMSLLPSFIVKTWVWIQYASLSFAIVCQPSQCLALFLSFFHGMVISLQWGSQLFSSKSGPEFSRKFWGLGSFTSWVGNCMLGCLMCRCMCSRIKLSLCSLAPTIRTGTAQLCRSSVCFRIA